MPFSPADRPDQVAFPIAELLGSDGQTFCTGWRLDPRDGSMKAAVRQRDKWTAAKSAGGTPEVPEPRAAAVHGFEDGDIVFDFMRNNDEQRYEVSTMYARPTQPKPTGNPSGLG